jgi:hypothetical protein
MVTYGKMATKDSLSMSFNLDFYRLVMGQEFSIRTYIT